MDKVPSLEILDCSCGRQAEVWHFLAGQWTLVGCKTCGVAAAAYKDLNQASADWNNIQKFVDKKDKCL